MAKTKYVPYDITNEHGDILATIEATSEEMAVKFHLDRQKEVVTAKRQLHKSPYDSSSMEHRLHEMIVNQFKENGCFTYPDGSKI